MSEAGNGGPFFPLTQSGCFFSSFLIHLFSAFPAAAQFFELLLCLLQTSLNPARGHPATGVLLPRERVWVQGLSVTGVRVLSLSLLGKLMFSF